MNKKDKELMEGIISRYENVSHLKFKHSSGSTDPKEIKPPYFSFIQYPEPHIEITEWSIFELGWYDMREYIEPLAEQAFLTYFCCFYLSSILCSSSCVEYILKYELFRKKPREESKKLYKSRLSLGSFVEKEEYLKDLNLLNFKLKIEYLNNLRNGFFHFNSEKLLKISNLEKEEIFDGVIPTDQAIHHPRYAYNAYEIMLEIINHFYSEKRRKENIKECIKDAELNMEKALNTMKKNCPWFTEMYPNFVKNKLENYKKGFYKRYKEKV